MTSNVGSEYITEMGAIGFNAKAEEGIKESLKTKVTEALKDTFRPEFLNRIDDIVIFNHLSKEDINQITELELEKVVKRMKENNNITITFQKSVKDMLAEKGFDRERGARPMKRLIQNKILNPLALEIISKDICRGERITVKMKGDDVVFEGVKSKSKNQKISA
jgi:ATP-dependent Clp protease ATP-binding subunit ClpA